MPATAADLKFMSSKVMLDTDAAGAGRSSTVLQTGASNSIFADVPPADRLTGKTNVRKVYVGPLNADLAAVQSAALMVDEVPTDAAVSVAIWAYGGSTTTRAQAVQALRDSRQQAGFAPSPAAIGVLYTGQANCWVLTGDNAPAQPVAVQTAVKAGGVWSRTDFKAIPGVTIDISNPSTPSTPMQWGITEFGAEQTVDAGATGYRYRVSTNNKPSGMGLDISTSAPGLPMTVRYPNRWSAAGPVRVYGALPLAAETETGDDVAIVGLAVRVASGTQASADKGFPPFAGYSGQPDNHMAVFLPGDVVTLWHETITTAATAVNGGTVDVGRTGLDELAVVGANDLEIARFLRNGPSPGTSCTADLDAGTVTFVDVTGYSQPVRVRHRIAHTTTLARVANGGVGLADTVPADFPAGSIISSHMPLGDLAARVENVFCQGAWTRVWADSVVGNSLPLMYSGTIGLTNQGAETDRYAIVMGTDGESFTCYSELLGQIASGSTGANFSPTNPATGAPLFTLYSASWALELPVEGVLRFNTCSAQPPFWILRCTQPSTAAGTTSTAVAILGGVDA